jgi:hypothetical protein
MLHATAHWKATIHIYSLTKFQKIPQKITITTACPNQQKAVLAYIVLYGLREYKYNWAPVSGKKTPTPL